MPFGTLKNPLPAVGKKNAISVCMIVKNEEANIARALQSFLPFADEIIVNDTGSTDQTIEIVKKLQADCRTKKRPNNDEFIKIREPLLTSQVVGRGSLSDKGELRKCLSNDDSPSPLKTPDLRIYDSGEFLEVSIIQSEWIGDFAYSRNLSIDKASCSWILWMDADDFVPPEQAVLFNKLKTLPLNRLIQFVVCNTEEGKPTGMRFSQARMFPNHPKMRFKGRIHEGVMDSAYELGLTLQKSEILIWHMGYESLEIRQKKARRNLELQLQDPEQENQIAGLIQLGDSYSILDDSEKAISYYKRGAEFDAGSDLQKELRLDGFVKWARHLDKERKFEEAIEIYDKCLKLFPQSEEAIFGRGAALLAQNKKAESMPYFKKILTLKPVITVGGTNYYNIKLDSLKNLSLWEFEQENFEQSKDYAAQMLKVEPQNKDGKWLFERADLAILNKRDPRPLLSICMIVKNEEKNIGECLKSAKGLADEIIVADTGSTDRTVEIAEEYGARIERTEWKKDFAAARNFSISHAKGRWVMWIDADDRVAKKTVTELRKILEREKPDKIFSLVVCNSIDEGKSGPKFSQVRVFPNNPQIKFEGRIHEQTVVSIRKLNLTEVSLTLEIYHTGYEDPSLLAGKQRRNLEIFREEFPDLDKMNPNAMFHYAASLEIVGDYDESIIWHKKALEKSKKEHYVEFEILIPHDIARILDTKGDFKGSLEWVNISLAKDPYFEPSLSIKANLLVKFGEIDEAVKVYGYLASLSFRPGFLPSNTAQSRVQALKFLSDHWNAAGDVALAVELLKLLKGWLEGTIEWKALALSEVYIMKDKGKEALDILEFLKKDFIGNPEFLFLYGQALALSGKVQDAIKTVSDAKKKFPQNNDLAELAKAMGLE
ncbi:hypothetical protein AGMMS49938_11990 [Fibrobacterales bacterium]|nr:hypothetical protein AGMMS49938_11990 [Fibrobacterales bacterium]